MGGLRKLGKLFPSGKENNKGNVIAPWKAEIPWNCWNYVLEENKEAGEGCVLRWVWGKNRYSVGITLPVNQRIILFITWEFQRLPRE